METVEMDCTYEQMNRIICSKKKTYFKYYSKYVIQCYSMYGQAETLLLHLSNCASQHDIHQS